MHHGPGPTNQPSLFDRSVDDARGRRVAILRLPYSLGWRFKRHSLPQPVLGRVIHRVRLQMYPSSLIAKIAWTLTATAVTAGFLWLCVTLILVGAAPIAIAIAACVGALFCTHTWRLALGLQDFSDLDISTDLIAASIQREGFCPSCAQSLEGLPHASDGCTICPECGAAWRLSAHEPPRTDGVSPPSPRPMTEDSPVKHDSDDP